MSTATWKINKGTRRHHGRWSRDDFDLNRAWQWNWLLAKTTQYEWMRPSPRKITRGYENTPVKIARLMGVGKVEEIELFTYELTEIMYCDSAAPTSEDGILNAPSASGRMGDGGPRQRMLLQPPMSIREMMSKWLCRGHANEALNEQVGYNDTYDTIYLDQGRIHDGNVRRSRATGEYHEQSRSAATPNRSRTGRAEEERMVLVASSKPVISIIVMRFSSPGASAVSSAVTIAKQRHGLHRHRCLCVRERRSVMSEATVNCHQCGEIPVRSVEIWQSVTIGTRPVVLIDGSWGGWQIGVYMDTNSDGFGAMCSRCQSEIDILDLPDGFRTCDSAERVHRHYAERNQIMKTKVEPATHNAVLRDGALDDKELEELTSTAPAIK